MPLLQSDLEETHGEALAVPALLPAVAMTAWEVFGAGVLFWSALLAVLVWTL